MFLKRDGILYNFITFIMNFANCIIVSVETWMQLEYYKIEKPITMHKFALLQQWQSIQLKLKYNSNLELKRRN